MTHSLVDNLAMIGSDNNLAPDQRQSITQTSAALLPIGPLGTNLNDIRIEIQNFSFTKISLEDHFLIQ